MSRSLKKGPFIDPKLLKRIEAMNSKGEKKDRAEFDKCAQIIAGRQEQPYRQHGSGETVYGEGDDDLFTRQRKI